MWFRWMICLGVGEGDGGEAEVFCLERLHSDYDMLGLLGSHYHPEVIAEVSDARTMQTS